MKSFSSKTQKALLVVCAFIALFSGSALAGAGYGLSNIFTINNSNPYIDFSSISNQQAGKDFNVSITAKKAIGQTETSFNSNVQLYALGGPRLNMTSVTLKNGVWNGTLNLDSAGDNVSITAGAGNISGTSNGFSVNSLLGSKGRIEGKCVGDDGLPVLGLPMTVDLNWGVLLVASTTTNTSTGRYSFTNISVGTYTIKAHGTIGTSTTHNLPVIANKTSTQDLAINGCVVPVILVPGMMGSSTDWEHIKGLRTTKLTNLKFYNPYDYVGWDKLRNALSQKGYKVFDAPWDWRREINDETVEWYLKEKIDEAKRDTGKDKVCIVAHSQGGLLVRYYIQNYMQGSGYCNDIDKLALVGTPNGGAAGDAYYLWEAADIERIDDTQIHSKAKFIKNFYIDARGKSPWTDDWQWSNELMYKVPQSDIKAVIQDWIPGLKQTMLTSSPLLAFMDSQGCGYQDYPGKELLTSYTLSQSSNKNRLVPGNTQATANNQVRTRMFRSQSESKTPACIVVNKVDSYRELYPLGTPTGKTFYNAGDGTVLWSSAEFGLDASNFDSPTTIKAGEHGKLPGIYADDIVSFFNEDTDAAASVNSMQLARNSLSETAQEEVASQMICEIDGSVQPILTSPEGQRLGIADTTGDLVEELAGEISVQPDFSSISASNPENGTYMLDFTGDANEVINIAIHYVVGENVFSVERSLLAGPGTNHVGVLVDSNSEEPVKIIEPVSMISNLNATSVSGLTQLKWDALTDATAVGYLVYGRRDGYRLFELLGQTTEAEYQTGHPWYQDETTDLWSYIVVAITSDGRESFFDSMASNQELLIACFEANVVNGEAPFTVKFTDQSTGNPTAWEWDFDGDGVIDSNEQNPSWTYTKRGSYTVICKVTAGDKSDTTIRTGYINVTANILADGVDISDLAYMAQAWLTSDPSADIAPDGGDGIVNFLDFAKLAESWNQVSE